MDLKKEFELLNSRYFDEALVEKSVQLAQKYAETHHNLQLQQTDVSSSVFTKETFTDFIQKIGFRICGKSPFSYLIDKDSQKTRIRIGNDGIELKSLNTSFCIFFQYGKAKLSINDENDVVTVSNEDESIFINLYGF